MAEPLQKRRRLAPHVIESPLRALDVLTPVNAFLTHADVANLGVAQGHRSRARRWNVHSTDVGRTLVVDVDSIETLVDCKLTFIKGVDYEVGGYIYSHASTLTETTIDRDPFFMEDGKGGDELIQFDHLAIQGHMPDNLTDPRLVGNPRTAPLTEDQTQALKRMAGQGSSYFGDEVFDSKGAVVRRRPGDRHPWVNLIKENIAARRAAAAAGDGTAAPTIKDEDVPITQFDAYWDPSRIGHIDAKQYAQDKVVARRYAAEVQHKYAEILPRRAWANDDTGRILRGEVATPFSLFSEVDITIHSNRPPPGLRLKYFRLVALLTHVIMNRKVKHITAKNFNGFDPVLDVLAYTILRARSAKDPETGKPLYPVTFNVYCPTRAAQWPGVLPLWPMLATNIRCPLRQLFFASDTASIPRLRDRFYRYLFDTGDGRRLIPGDAEAKNRYHRDLLTYNEYVPGVTWGPALCSDWAAPPRYPPLLFNGQDPRLLETFFGQEFSWADWPKNLGVVADPVINFTHRGVSIYPSIHREEAAHDLPAWINSGWWYRWAVVLSGKIVWYTIPVKGATPFDNSLFFWSVRKAITDGQEVDDDDPSRFRHVFRPTNLGGKRNPLRLEG